MSRQTRSLVTITVSWLLAVGLWSALAGPQIFGPENTSGIGLWLLLGLVCVCYLLPTVRATQHTRQEQIGLCLVYGVVFLLPAAFGIGRPELVAWVIGVPFLALLAHALRLGWQGVALVATCGGLAGWPGHYEANAFDALYGSPTFGRFWFVSAIGWHVVAGALCIAAIIKHHRMVRKNDPRLCPSCGYPTEGLPRDAPCPECGDDSSYST